MEKLINKINKIPKGYFTFADIRKISNLKEESLRVILARLVKRGEILSLRKGIYAVDISKINWEQLAIDLYSPSYHSFEWALSRHNLLSQRPASFTLATLKRANRIEIKNNLFIYRHIKRELFWGFDKYDNYLMADPEKSFLDLAYLSLNGYAKFDPDEMNFGLINKIKLKKYLNRFNHKKLYNLIKRFLK